MKHEGTPTPPTGSTAETAALAEAINNLGVNDRTARGLAAVSTGETVTFGNVLNGLGANDAKYRAIASLSPGEIAGAKSQAVAELRADMAQEPTPEI